MKLNIQLIRNATLVVEYSGKKFLIDPLLAEQRAYLPYPTRENKKNTLVGLPTSVEKIIANIDVVIVTHLHLDHWDDAAKKALPKDVKLFVKNEKDAKKIKNDGFQNAEILHKDTVFNVFVPDDGESYTF